jgi:hypothetical protein
MKERRQRNLKEIVDSLAPVVYPALREEYTRDCCIAAAAILTRVFDEYGYRAEVVPVTVHIFNAAMVSLINKGPLPDDETQRHMLFDLTGAHGVGIVPASATLSAASRVRGGGYGGHLLLRVENWLIDATIRQAERLEKKMPLPNMIAVDRADQLERNGRLNLSVGSCELVYARIHDQSYRTAPDWTRRSTPYPETVRKILARATQGELHARHAH